MGYVASPLLDQWGAVRPFRKRRSMREVLRSSDLVLIGFVEALLRGSNVQCFVADRHMSGLEAGIGAFPRRVMVEDEDVYQARRILSESGFAAELRQPSE